MSIDRRGVVRCRLLLAGALLVALILALPSGAAARPASIEDYRGSRELIVRFAPQAEFNATARKIAHLRAGTARVRGLHGMLGHDLVAVPKGSSVSEVMRRYRVDPSVLYVEPNYPVSVATMPSDPLFAEQWALENTGQNGGKAGADIGAPAAWTVSTGSPDVLVAVIDTGVDYDHPDLAPNMWRGLGWNFVENNDDPMDIHGHGTHVAGTIAAVADDGFGMAGVAWEARVMALKALSNSGSGLTSDIAEAVTFASNNGADVINMSLAGGSYSQALYDAIAASDALVVCAAGNSGSDNDSSPQYPAAYNLDNIVSVAATDSADKLASFSNYGAESVDVGAPGVAILSTVPGATYSATTVFNDSLDTLGAWDTSDFNSNPWALNSKYYVSPSYSAGHAPTGGYAAYEQSWITMRDYISLTESHRVMISFNAALDTVSADDWLLVAAEVEGGHWEALGYVSGSTGGKFNSYTIEVSKLAGSRARLAFIFLGGEIGGGMGAWVDDVKVYSMTRDGNADYSGAHGYKSGTSMAAPHVAGVAALLKSYVPSLDAGEMKEAILSSVEQLDTLSGKTLTGGRLDAAGMLVSVQPPNAAPIANDSAYAIGAGSELVVAAPGVMSNDTDADGDALWSILEADVSNGTLALATDGSFTYTPGEGFTGTDTFTYRAHDGTDYSDVANVTITVTPPGHTLTYRSGGGGTIDGASPQYITDGGAGTAVSALADHGYRFSRWSDDVMTASRIDTDVTADVSVTALFLKDATVVATAVSKTYDGTDTAQVTLAVKGLLDESHDVSATYTRATFEQSGVGADLTVTLTGIALEGDDAGSYHLLVDTATATADITARPIEMIADDATKVFGDPDPDLTYTVTGGSLVSGDAVSGTLSRQAGEDVGDYVISQGTLALSADYEFTFVGGRFTITPATPMVTVWPTASRIQFGEALSASTLSGGTADVPGTFAFSDDTVVPDVAGIYMAVVTFTPDDALNYATDTDTVDVFVMRTYALSYTAGAGGTISGITPQTVEHGSDGGPVTAVANTGYTFVKWSDGLTTATRTDTNVTADKSVSATFGLETAPPPSVSIAGSDRYLTAIAGSKYAFPFGAPAVVIATGENFADALGGAGLAGSLDAPLLLTQKNALPSSVLNEITRLKATKAYVLGGTGAVSSGVEAALKAKLGNVNVIRLAGANRYDTANRVAAETIKLLGTSYQGGAFIATGANFPDALGASPVAAAKGMPVILADPTRASLTLPAQVRSVVICGGTAAVPGAIERALNSRLGSANVTRLAGANRFDTAARVATWGASRSMSWNGAGITTSMNFPDALAAGPVLGSADAVMLLTDANSVPTPTSRALSAHKADIDTVHFFGGTAAVPTSVRTALLQLVQ